MERLVDPLTTTDAKLWADEFMKVKARLGEQKFDHAMMLGWFANAIMQGYDEGRRRAKADAQATVEALQRGLDEHEAERLAHFKEFCTANEKALALQTALDAEREKVAFLEKKNANLVEASNLVLKVKADQDKRISTMQTKLTQLQALVRVYKEAVDYYAKTAISARAVDALEKAATLGTTTTAVCPDCDGDGAVDSGGTDPNGNPLMRRCGCRAKGGDGE